MTVVSQNIAVEPLIVPTIIHRGDKVSRGGKCSENTSTSRDKVYNAYWNLAEKVATENSSERRSDLRLPRVVEPEIIPVCVKAGKTIRKNYQKKDAIRQSFIDECVGLMHGAN